MKRLLIVAVLVTAVSQLAHAANSSPILGPGGKQHLLGPGGTRNMPGQNGGGLQSLASRQAVVKRQCHRAGQAYYAVPNSVGRCIKAGLLGASNKGKFVGGVY